MKLTTLIMLLFCVHLSAKTSSQTITLSGKHLPLEKVFSAIEKQTGLLVLGNAVFLKESKPVSFSVSNMPLVDFLQHILQDQPLGFTIIDRTVVLSRKVLPVASDPPLPPVTADLPALRDLTGQLINSETNDPVSSASISIYGSRLGTSSDDQGRFALSGLADDAVLVISSIGFSSIKVPLARLLTLSEGKSFSIDENTITKNSAGSFVFKLKIAVKSLEETVVIGYGAVKRRDLTGSISMIKGSDIESAPVASVDQALQGKAAGTQVTSVNGAPGAGTTIRIRGGNSISASNEPLYVVDGFIGAGNLTSINPTDIESIEILKDASATAIYGARGSNGVILITTKHGKAGQSNIAVNAYTGVQQLPKEVALLNGPQLADFVNERAALYGAVPVYPDVSKVTTTDWQKAITQNASLQNANIAFSGGSEKVNYYLSGNYFNQDGIILNSGFKRYQTRLNLSLKLTNWLTVGTDLNFNRSNTNNNKVNLYDILKSAPTSSPVKDSNGKYIIVSPLSGQTFENPVAVAKMDLNNTYDNGLLGNWFAQASFKNGLQLRSTLAINNDNSKAEQYQPGALPLRSTQQLGGYAYISSAQTLNLLNENTVSFNRNFGKHHINLLGGFTYQHETDESYSATGQGYTNDLLTYNNLATGDPLQAKISSTQTEWTIISLLGRLNYSFNDKYLLTVSARQDGSSRLSANHKEAFFPSAAFAWRLYNEDFIKELGWFSDLKFRASYGKTGNQAVGVYSTLASLSVTNAYFNNTQQTGYTLGTIPNDNLKWETTDQYNAGLDAGFFNGRLSLTLDAYYKKTYNLLLTAQIPGTTGYTTRLENVGTVQNKGIELSLDGKIIDTRDLSWDLGFNISGNRNKVVSLGKGLQYRDITDGARLIVGKPAPLFFGAVYEGTYKSQQEIDALPTPVAGLLPGFPKFKDVNGNGKYDGLADYAPIGNPEPKFFGGFNTSLRYKRFSLNAYFEYTYGNDIINSFAPRLFMGEYASNVGAQAVNRWTPTNNQSNLPRVGSYTIYTVNSQAYSFAVQDGSFLRLKTLQLSYNLPTEKITWLRGASIYFTGSNLFIIDHYTWGYDPEVSANGTDPVLRGFDGYSYPQNRSFLFGINLKF